MWCHHALVLFVWCCIILHGDIVCDMLHPHQVIFCCLPKTSLYWQKKNNNKLSPLSLPIPWCISTEDTEDACLVPKLFPRAMLQAMESWMGSGNGASIVHGQYGEAMHEFRAMFCRLRIYSAGYIAQGSVTKFTDGCVCEQTCACMQKVLNRPFLVWVVSRLF